MLPFSVISLIILLNWHHAIIYRMQIVRTGHLRDKGVCGNAGETRVEIALCIIPYDAVKRECGSQGRQYIEAKNT